MSLLGEDGVARMDLFEQYDINHDAKLDVGEAIDLLKTTLKEWEITTDWVTADWVGQQFRTVTGEGDADVRGAVAITHDEFQIFCSNIMNFICHLGPAMEKATPREGDAPPVQHQHDEPPEDEVAVKSDAASGGCCVIL